MRGRRWHRRDCGGRRGGRDGPGARAGRGKSGRHGGPIRTGPAGKPHAGGKPGPRTPERGPFGSLTLWPLPLTSATPRADLGGGRELSSACMRRFGRAGALSRTVGIEGRARKPAVCGGPLCQLCPGTARPSPPGLASLGPVPWCPQTHQGERGLGSRTLFPRARWSAGYWPATATLELPRGQTQEQGPPWVGLRTQCHQRRSQDLTCVQGCGSQGHAGPVRLGQRTAAARTEDLFTQLRTQT